MTECREENEGNSSVLNQWKDIDMSSEEENQTIVISKPGRLKVEDVYERLGGFSTFQIFAAIVILALEMPGAMVALSPILIATNHVDFYCETNTSSVVLSKEQLCTSSCEGKIVSKEPFISIVQEWQLICDKAWVSDTLTSIQMAGSTLGPLVTAQISDRYGRKPAFYIICTLLGVIGIVSSQAGDIRVYAVSKFVAGLIAGGCIVAHMNYLLEFLTPSWRAICGCVTLWPVGEMLLGLVGYFIPSWRTLSWISVLPCAVLLGTFPFLPESPRWLLINRRSEEAAKVFAQIAKWNSKPALDPETLALLQESVMTDKESNKISTEERNDPKRETSRWTAFKERQILKQIIVFFFAWFANAVVYYGISFNMKNMSGNPYVNVFLLGLLDLPAELSGIYFSNRYGRKPTFITFLMGSVVFLVALASVQVAVDEADVKYGVWILVLCLMGRFCNEASWGVMAGFTGESFPTVIRSLCFSICTVASSLGAVIAPQMAYLGSIWAPGPYVVFSGISTLSCLTSLMLVEMKDKPLRDINH